MPEEEECPYVHTDNYPGFPSRKVRAMLKPLPAVAHRPISATMGNDWQRAAATRFTVLMPL
ncbi:hypothetical protein CCM_02583 [Cordyceps militaris CM01]|uniref:Uncharacterized protein n=1 Tax=Cordyceps militaris (strain CM01) TaxID=983644 RepID=G3JAJ6_CORMM|nr:uncharacterized protein CCM_02583 [Cordyceps militaris CM01]EGX94312.1 hypothetical protein CCM_02583 [Cordyceps militaris CM01]